MTRLALACALLLSACARPRPGDKPEISLGRHECARCGMIVSEERHAGGYVDDAGETVPFDDVGELLAAVSGKPELAARAWVHDFESGAWLPLKEAYPAKVPGLATPMGTGWAAFKDQGRAEAFSARKGG